MKKNRWFQAFRVDLCMIKARDGFAVKYPYSVSKPAAV